MPRPRKARVEGEATMPAKPADPVPGDNGAALRRIVAFFEAEHPEAWEAIKLCPTLHGVEEMARLLG